MKIKNKKTIVAITALLLIAVVGITFAYFQSTGTFANVFQTGKYRLVTTEVFESPDNWKPGETIEKTITTKNEGTIPAAVRVSYTEEWFDSEEHDITNSIDEGSAIINFANTDEWIEENGYYYYKYILEPNETTSSFISSVTLNEDLDDVTCSTEGLTHVCESENPALGAKYVLTITKDTVEYDKYHEHWNTNVSIIEKPASSITYLTRQVEGQITPGDVIGIGETEDFYVISSDNSENGKTVLLAKYNLLVGNAFADGFVDIGPIPTDTPGYGLQNVDSIGYTSPWEGGVYFADTNYWMNGNTLKSKYSQNGTIYYDENGNWGENFKYVADNSVAHPYVYDENSNLYELINGENGYINRLIAMGAPNTITGRLLTYEEADASQNVEDNGVSIIFGIHNSLIGSAYDNDSVDGITEEQPGFYSVPYDYVYYLGLRPVIEIPTSALQ